MKRFRTVLFSLAASAVLLAGAAQAQNIPGLGGGGTSRSIPGLGGQLPGGGMSGSGMSGLGGAALPSVSSAGTANTTGILSYCVQNNYLQGGTATSALSSLSGRSGVQSTSAFSAGQQGQLETGNGSMFSMSGLPTQVRSKVCDMVLQHAQSMM